MKRKEKTLFFISLPFLVLSFVLICFVIFVFVTNLLSKQKYQNPEYNREYIQNLFFENKASFEAIRDFMFSEESDVYCRYRDNYKYIENWGDLKNNQIYEEFKKAKVSSLVVYFEMDSNLNKPNYFCIEFTFPKGNNEDFQKFFIIYNGKIRETYHNGANPRQHLGDGWHYDHIAYA